MHEKDSTGGIISGIMLFAAGYFLFSLFRAADTFDITGIKVFNTIFISILMQALPFMLVGVFVSSAMHVYLSDEMLVRIFPLRNGIGFLTVMLGGIFFPVCECAIVPVAVRLVKKGVALPVALVFMFSAPIINPIVIISTLYAFPGHPEAALLRVGLGLFIALVIGLIILLLGIRTPLLTVGHDAACCDCCHEESFAHKTAGYKVRALFSYAGDEFFDVGEIYHRRRVHDRSASNDNTQEHICGFIVAGRSFSFHYDDYGFFIFRMLHIGRLYCQKLSGPVFHGIGHGLYGVWTDDGY